MKNQINQKITNTIFEQVIIAAYIKKSIFHWYKLIWNDKIVREQIDFKAASKKKEEFYW